MLIALPIVFLGLTRDSRYAVDVATPKISRKLAPDRFSPQQSDTVSQSVYCTHTTLVVVVHCELFDVGAHIAVFDVAACN